MKHYLVVSGAQDRMEIFGLHTVNPFLQKDIAEFMFSIPHSLKIKKGVTKFLLREATKETLPETTRNRLQRLDGMRRHIYGSQVKI